MEIIYFNKILFFHSFCVLCFVFYVRCFVFCGFFPFPTQREKEIPAWERTFAGSPSLNELDLKINKEDLFVDCSKTDIDTKKEELSRSNSTALIKIAPFQPFFPPISLLIRDGISRRKLWGVFVSLFFFFFFFFLFFLFFFFRGENHHDSCGDCLHCVGHCVGLGVGGSP